MTPKQRYLFDVTGYLHLENVITGDALAEAAEAVDRYITTPPDALPPGFEQKDSINTGSLFDKSLECLTMHTALWPIIKELTDNQPRFGRGSLKHDKHDLWETGENAKVNPGGLHCARDDYGWYSTRYEVDNGRIYCDNFVCFPYFTDVYSGDGGLIVIPGSHKSEFKRPKELLTLDEKDGIDRLTILFLSTLHRRRGDIVIISELLTHGVLRWKPKDRDRRFLVLRYFPQYSGRHSFPQPILDQLSPETLELVASAGYGHIKEIVKQDAITLTV